MCLKNAENTFMERYLRVYPVLASFVTTPFLLQIRYLSHQMHDRSNQIGTKSKQFRTKSNKRD